MKKVSIAGFVAGLSSIIASGAAMANPGAIPPRPVPEISALEGTAALAALAAIVLLTWERRRRAA